MKKPIDNSNKTASKKKQVENLSDTNESDSIIVEADDFVLFPMDIQKTTIITNIALYISKLINNLLQKYD
jgi:hypothetical protein